MSRKFLMLLTVLALFFVLSAALSAHSETVAKLPGKSSKKYYTEGKKFIMLKISKNLEAYVNKKNQKVYYYYHKAYYF